MAQIKLTLSPDTRYFIEKISSSDYENLVFEAFLAPDLIYTLSLRSFRLIQRDIGGDESTQGATIDWLSQNPGVTALVTLGILAFAAANLYREYKKQKRAQDSNSHRFIYGQLDKEDQDVVDQEIAKDAEVIRRQNELTEIKNTEIKDAAELHHGNAADIKRERDKRKIEKEKADAEAIVAFETFVESKRTEIIERRKKERRDEINKYLKQIREEDEDIRNKYDDVTINDEGQIVFELKEKRQAPPTNEAGTKTFYQKYIEAPARWINKTVLAPVYGVLGISSFAYWLMWIGAAAFTHQTETGVVGLGNSAFVIAFSFGLIYPFIKLYNYYYGRHQKKHKNEGDKSVSDEKVEESAQDAAALLRRVAQRMECAKSRKQYAKAEYGLNEEDINRIEKESKEKMEGIAQGAAYWNKKLDYLTQDSALRTALTFTTDATGTYVGLQYAFWIVTDFLSKVANVTANIPIINLAAGLAVMGVSVLHGIWKAGTGYFARQKQITETLESAVYKAGQQQNTLENLYKLKCKQIDDLQNILQVRDGKRVDLPAPVDYKQSQLNTMGRSGRSKFTGRLEFLNKYVDLTTVKKVAVRALTFVNNFMTGAFVARLFLVNGNALILPFAAATLSNPWTIGLVVAVGVVYGAIRLYEYHVRQKEARARDLLKKQAEQNDRLKAAIIDLDLKLELLHKKVFPKSKVVAELKPAETLTETKELESKETLTDTKELEPKEILDNHFSDSEKGLIDSRPTYDPEASSKWTSAQDEEEKKIKLGRSSQTLFRGEVEPAQKNESIFATAGRVIRRYIG